MSRLGDLDSALPRRATIGLGRNQSHSELLNINDFNDARRGLSITRTEVPVSLGAPARFNRLPSCRRFCIERVARRLWTDKEFDPPLDEPLGLFLRPLRECGSLPGVVADEEVGPHLERGALEPEIPKDLPGKGEPLIVDPIDPSEDLRIALRPRPEREVEFPEILLPDHLGGPQQAVRGGKNGNFDVRGHNSRELILPVLEQLFLEIIAVFEVPVETAFRDVEVAGESLHADSLDPFSLEHIERYFKPVGLLSPDLVLPGRHEIMLAGHECGIRSEAGTLGYRNPDGGVQIDGVKRRVKRQGIQGH